MFFEKYDFSPLKTIIVIVVMIMTSISIGIIGAEDSGISYFNFIPNIVGVFLGILLFILVINFKSFVHKYTFEISLLALAFLFSPFFSEGIEDVFRWLKVGPILIHISSFIIPLLLYNYFKFEEINLYKAFIPIIITSFILVFQPDAGQSLALLFGMLPFLFRNIKERKIIILWVTLLLLSAIAWFQPDPLMPVEHVENIFLLIYKLQPFGEVLIVTSMACLFVPIVYIGGFGNKLTLSILLYFFGGLVATLFGHFPVQVIGAGASPVLGMFLALSLIYSEIEINS